MISIVISSYQPTYLNALKINLEQTVGVPFEIIVIENAGLMGICEAYNLGAMKAKFPYLVFAHEDILFKTYNWSKPLTDKFESDTTTGIIGIAGGKYKSISPSIWISGVDGLDPIQIIQHSKSKQNEYSNYLNEQFDEVVCLDGVFMFTKKEFWQENKFDQNTFKNFHCYDLDFSFQIGLKRKVLVTNTVLIEHFSLGSYDKSWIDESIKFHKKWKTLLPKGKIPYTIKKEIEYNNIISFLLRMVEFKYSLYKLLSVGFEFGIFRFFSIFKSMVIFKIIITGYLKNTSWIRK